MTDEYKFRNKDGIPVYWSKLLGLGQRFNVPSHTDGSPACEVRTALECTGDDLTGWEGGGVPSRWPHEREVCEHNGITHFPDGSAVADDFEDEATV